MRSAANVLIPLLALLGACQQGTEENDAAATEPNSAAGVPPGTEFETLPADESSTTPSGELNSGQESPETNEPSNGL